MILHNLGQITFQFQNIRRNQRASQLHLVTTPLELCIYLCKGKPFFKLKKFFEKGGLKKKSNVPFTELSLPGEGTLLHSKTHVWIPGSRAVNRNEFFISR